MTRTYNTCYLHKAILGDSSVPPNAYTSEVLFYPTPFSDAQMRNKSIELMAKWGLANPQAASSQVLARSDT